MNKKAQGLGKEEKMKKQFAMLLVTMGIMGTIFTGCGKEDTTTQPPAAPESSVETTPQQEEVPNMEADTQISSDAQTQAGTTGGTKTVSGKLEDKKDMLFILTSDSGESYAIGFETAPQGYDQLKAGDAVVMEYTGELSEVDSFTGEIISLKLAQ